ncbi:MAG: hypothetical protein SAK29_24990 [Scytonema sp. PMC 1069.18]|nr:hypothetical protein [Scytonema sp. PMC 1069.18]MEC4880481.1 hypothetical protein [Scytonema sp. PMC 1070.18]
MTFLEENIVIIAGILSITIMSWLIVSCRETRKALRWWYHKQHLRMYQEAESIRNKTLQELFVLRRHLELLEFNQIEYGFDTHYLNNIQKVHNSLKELSEFLYPAHIDDSLPLAIRFLLESWKLRFSELNIKLELPEVWEDESEEQRRVLLMLIEELMEIFVLKSSSLPSILVTLESRNDKNNLKIEIEIAENNVSNSMYDSHLEELDFLCRVFRTFTDGECSYRLESFIQTWNLSWNKL